MEQSGSKGQSAFGRDLVAFLLVLSLAACDSGHAAGDREAGSRLAGQWCGGCHASGTSAEGSDAAPSFQRIAQERKEDTAWLRAWLGSPHPNMPDMNLTRGEIDDIIAYLAGLATP